MTKYIGPSPKFRCTDQNGVPLDGGFLTVYAAGTTTLASTYSNASGTANSNPITLDSSGECDLWLDAGVYYDLRATDSAGVLQYTVNRLSCSVPPSSYMAGLMQESSLSNVFSNSIGEGGTFTSDLNLVNAALNYAADVSMLSASTTPIGAAASNNVTVTPSDGIYWNTSVKGTNLTLSNSNKTVTAGAGGIYGSIIGTTARSSGKYYFEVIVNLSTVTANILIGVGKSNITLNDYLGVDANGWCVAYSTGAGTAYRDYHSNVTNALSLNSGGNGTIIGVALDMDAGEIRSYKNNALLKTGGGAIFSGITGSLYPAMSLFNNTDNATLRLFTSEFTYSPPSGYSEWGFSV